MIPVGGLNSGRKESGVIKFLTKMKADKREKWTEILYKHSIYTAKTSKPLNKKIKYVGKQITKLEARSIKKISDYGRKDQTNLVKDMIHISLLCEISYCT